MQKRILEFANILRKSGIRVSTAEALDAFHALDALPIDDREVFRDALCAAMVKRGDEVASFHELFDLFWSGFYDSLRAAFNEAEGNLPKGLDLSSLLKQISELLKGAATWLNLTNCWNDVSGAHTLPAPWWQAQA